MPSLSKLDSVYRSLLLAKFFTKGWGKPDNLKRLFAFRKVICNRESCKHLVSPDYPVSIVKVENHQHYQILDGEFTSPFNHYLPEVIPDESKTARFQVLLPKVWPAEPLRPICLHLAGTGDHFYWRRRVLMAKPLLKEAGIASIILENPFYGSRKPECQRRSSLHNVSDIFVMGGCLILESLALFHWCERQGFGPLGISGISMGGHMASVAGCSWHKPLPIIPCLSWSTASCVFTQGVMSGAIPWPLLQNQYNSDIVYQQEIRQIAHSDESDAFHAGVHFSRNFPSSMEHMHLLASEPQMQPVSNEGNSHNSLTNNPSSNKLPSELYMSSQRTKSIQSNSNSDDATSGKGPRASAPSKSESHRQRTEALNFMRGIMDDCTHLGNFTTPVDPTLSIVVSAKHDAYVPTEGIASIAELWPGCEIRYIDCGHIAAFLFNQGVFRKAVIDAFERTAQKYHGGSILGNSKIPLKQDANS